jgi:hypothetical protein
MTLVSQIYNLPGKWTDLVFWWCVVSVPLAWVFRSQAVAIAYLVGVAVWAVAQAGERGASFSAAQVADLRVWFPVLLAGILPLWPGPDLRARPAPGGRLDHAGIAEPLAAKPQVVLGGLALVVMALVATYEDPARELVKGVGLALPAGWCWLLLAVVVAFAAIAFRQGRFTVLTVAGLAVVPLVAHALARPAAGGWPCAIAYSLVLLATAIVLIALEFLGRQGAARIGAALITILVILRMADADVSLLTKGIAFIAIGCGFLGFNVLVSRRRAASGGVVA